MALISVQYAIATPNVYTPIPGQPGPDILISAISEGLQKSGWLVAGNLSNSGVRLLGVSPQGYSVNLDLTQQKIGGSTVYNGVGWQLNSAVGTGAVAPLLITMYDPTYSYQLVSFPCGWFFSRPIGASGIPLTEATCGGIPYSPYAAEIGPQPSPPDVCNMGQTAAPSEIWWSMGFRSQFPNSVCNPRQSLDVDYGSTAGYPFPSGTGAQIYEQNCGCQSGVVTTGTTITDPGTPQILRFSSQWDEGTLGPAVGISQPIWYSGDDFLYPAFIAWGDATAKPAKIRGQLYNAICRSGKYPGDLIKGWDNYTWMNYTDQYFFGSLWAFLGGLGTGNWSW